MKDNTSVGSPFFGAFLSDRNPEETMDINAHSFIHSSYFCKNSSIERVKDFKYLGKTLITPWCRVLLDKLTGL